MKAIQFTRPQAEVLLLLVEMGWEHLCTRDMDTSNRAEMKLRMALKDSEPKPPLECEWTQDRTHPTAKGIE